MLNNNSLIKETFPDSSMQFNRFYNLMKFRVKEILLISSAYDAFVIEEDGSLTERLSTDFFDLSLSLIPRITRVSSASEALKLMQEVEFDIVITMARISDMDIIQLGEEIKQAKPELPVILLTYEMLNPDTLERFKKSPAIDKIFYWTGDTQTFLAIIKYAEDIKNAENDIKLGVKAILLIEDSPQFYSIFLPEVYTEIVQQTRDLVSDGVSDSQRLLRMRARPKILIAENYEEAEQILSKFKKSILGIISDIRFPHNGEYQDDAGIEFALAARAELKDIPILIQSSDPIPDNTVLEKNISFLDKNRQDLILEFRNFILRYFGFGDFIFRNGNGEKIETATDIYEFRNKLETIPDESIEYHARRNHISIWLRARTEFEIAELLRPKKITDFVDTSTLREYLVEAFEILIRNNQKGIITDFERTDLHTPNVFVKLGKGSLGGKARGIAFINKLINSNNIKSGVGNIRVTTPPTLAICSDFFDEFIRINDLLTFAINSDSDREIAERFLKATLPMELEFKLISFLESIDHPIAVRSSSLLEDSQVLPFAGLYSTYLLPNNSSSIGTRAAQLFRAVKLIYSSVFYRATKIYISNTNYRIEEEKMAVIIQQIVGKEYGNYFYPVLSGVAQSFNYYPFYHMEQDDGIAEIAMGLGATIAQGEKAYRFSPAYPEMPPPYASVEEFMNKSQKKFYAIDLSDPDITIEQDEICSLSHLSVTDAEDHGTLFFTASTYAPVDRALRDTVSIPGPRVLTFANILKYNQIPLPEVLHHILSEGHKAFGSHVEIEFAINIEKDEKNTKASFNLLQIRPMITERETSMVQICDGDRADAFIKTVHAMGNIYSNEVKDLVFVDPDKFNASKTRIIANEIAAINDKLRSSNRRYILISFGRLGTSDPWLGVPVDWAQMSEAALVIESSLDNFKITPSQGSHFFHNMTALKMGYFHIAKFGENEQIDWEWIKSIKPAEEREFVTHISFEEPCEIKIDGKSSTGVIKKPSPSEKWSEEKVCK